MILADLNELGKQAQERFLNYDKREFILSREFQQEFTKLLSSKGSDTIKFLDHTAIVTTSSALSITLPNQWFLIGYYFSDFIIELKKYRTELNALAVKDSDFKEKASAIRDKGIPESLIPIIDNHFQDINDKIKFKKFISEYDWWFGNKSVDRPDYYVSPVLSLSKVVNVSQSYIADLAYNMAGDSNLLTLLKKSLDVSYKNGVEKIVRNTLSEFVNDLFVFLVTSKHIDKILQYKTQNTNPKFESIDFEDKSLTSVFWVFNHIASNPEKQQAGKIRVFDEPLIVEEGKYYYLCKEWADTGDTRLDFQVLRYIFNKVYSGLYQIEKIDNKYTLMVVEHIARNQILYGPPGTGKTHNSVNHALSIIKGYSLKNIISEQRADKDARKKYKAEFDKLVNDGRIQFVTFHQSYSYEEFVEGIKPVVNSSGQVEYKIEDGVFKKICQSATGNLSKNIDDVYEEFINYVINENDNNIVLETLAQKKKFNVRINSNGSCVAIPQTASKTEMVVTKKFIADYIENDIIHDWKSYTTAIGDYIKEKFEIKKTNPAYDNAYVLIIDEINRGNISKIFGELITLIEDSKRLNQSEELRIKLAYSGVDEKQPLFGVPPNVYIIGTMNTADKSIALLDSALRRRFSFTEYTADSSLLSDDVDGIDLQKLLYTINSRIEILLDKDHLIGHSYFLGIDTKNKICEVLRNKILPLLQEYFYNDLEKIQYVLGDNAAWRNKACFVEIVKKRQQKDLFGQEIDGFEERNLYKIKSELINEDYDSISAQALIGIYTKENA